ncbi:acetyl-coenzyme A synthetase [Aspergillus uvarum CBS 121591]|uniref:Acetyl-coenzyme A synthetase n=1 Tax=Aspergillus uvarum CBS 121591 TaxID=1448315 RepID=A0A319C9Z2_9EURO|nr:acetyl-coenzyme A synthetase [Aspergillus uvarum CBS 121591]PYH82275.1 acetyl-coenzyme A synthetase [Aspergillus uvarum CBS 121591]
MTEPNAPTTMVDVPASYISNHPSTPHLASLNEYRDLYQESLRDPDHFWRAMATSALHWDQPFHTTRHGSLEAGDHAWFLGGRLNASYNCVDRHALATPDKPALLYEPDTPTRNQPPQQITYAELLRDVCRLAWVLRDLGVRKGEIVTVYMPNIPEAVVAMLACARIGAVHSVVFAGFSAPALRGRLQDARSRVILTVDEGVRGGKAVPMKRVVEDAVMGLRYGGGAGGGEEADVKCKCLVLRKTGSPVPWCQRMDDAWWHEECARWPGYYAPEAMGAEDPLFLLYTSGSTGKPKGLLHSTAGYLLGCAVSGKYVLDLHPADTMFCAGDVGWITGHSYSVYTPLVLGLATVLFDGTPSFPTCGRYWEILARTRATHFYTAPTALRLIKKGTGNTYAAAEAHDLERLRVVASIGEPLAAKVWQWCHDTLGGQVHVLDTYFQTETGCHAFAPLAGVTPTKPGYVALPFLGFNPILLDPVSGAEIRESETEGLLAFDQPWPSIARTVWGDHARYMKTYFAQHKGYFTTGDAAIRDGNGYFKILGRVDDVVNISGHRLSTGEIESALLNHGAFAEVAVVGSGDELTGQALVVFACLKNDLEDQTNKSQLRQSAQQHIGKWIGRFAVPRKVFLVDDLPKTRSGKIMRRILRKILEGEEKEFGDLSTVNIPFPWQ